MFSSWKFKVECYENFQRSLWYVVVAFKVIIGYCIGQQILFSYLKRKKGQEGDRDKSRVCTNSFTDKAKER